MNITVEIPEETIPFILGTLDKNPLGASVRQVANLMDIFTKAVEAQQPRSPTDSEPVIPQPQYMYGVPDDSLDCRG